MMTYYFYAPDFDAHQAFVGHDRLTTCAALTKAILARTIRTLDVAEFRRAVKSGNLQQLQAPDASRNLPGVWQEAHQ
jgi:hypothetical protein